MWIIDIDIKKHVHVVINYYKNINYTIQHLFKWWQKIFIMGKWACANEIDFNNEKDYLCAASSREIYL